MYSFVLHVKSYCFLASFLFVSRELSVIKKVTGLNLFIRPFDIFKFKLSSMPERIFNHPRPRNE